MIPAGIRVPCMKLPTLWDIPESVPTIADVAPARARARAAIQQCRHHCPALNDCEVAATADPPQHQIAHGVIYGHQRAPIAWRDWRGPTVRGIQTRCGTRAAAHRHRERGEPVDDACSHAERASWRERRQAQRARKKGTA